jgi:hypothetical protein
MLRLTVVYGVNLRLFISFLPRLIPHPPSSQFILGVNMMCAFGVPENMIHGPSFCGLSLNPVDTAVAYGM